MSVPLYSGKLVGAFDPTRCWVGAGVVVEMSGSAGAGFGAVGVGSGVADGSRQM
ncbi:MAG: hypothetical protein WBG53_01910 [Rhodococcus sp. (in: high G+C Gram-positive bacteria)]|uniref:hypothetical protein n=1 Tax=Rhodococcus sp. SBT000017 TaxID=1803385 RepID=UPI001604EB64|nr:hypothetical protein [Rhodococcus sp. SBT000017]